MSWPLLEAAARSKPDNADELGLRPAICRACNGYDDACEACNGAKIVWFELPALRIVRLAYELEESRKRLEAAAS